MSNKARETAHLSSRCSLESFLKVTTYVTNFPPNYNLQREWVREINLERRVADGIDGFN